MASSIYSWRNYFFPQYHSATEVAQYNTTVEGFAKWGKEALEEHGISRLTCAEKFRISVNTLSKWDKELNENYEKITLSKIGIPLTTPNLDSASSQLTDFLNQLLLSDKEKGEIFHDSQVNGLG